MLFRGFLKMNRLQVLLYEYLFHKEAFYKNQVTEYRNRLLRRDFDTFDVVEFLLVQHDYEAFRRFFDDVVTILNMFK